MRWAYGKKKTNSHIKKNLKKNCLLSQKMCIIRCFENCKTNQQQQKKNKGEKKKKQKKKTLHPSKFNP